MKRILFLFLLISGIAKAQIVNIPDANFKAKLLQASPSKRIASNVNPNSNVTPNVYTSVDTNGDGEIQYSEASQIVFLNLGNSSISSLEGIQAFVNLKILYVQQNDFTTLNVSGLSQLSTLFCDSNQLTSISIQGCTGLLNLSCSNNLLTGLDLTTVPNLRFLNFDSNQITSIDLNGLQNIRTVNGTENNLTTFSLANKNLLTTLNLGYNQLTSVDLRNLPHLYKVNLQDNDLTSIDLSTCAYERYLNNIPEASVYSIRCNNNLRLTKINLKNGFKNNSISFFSTNLTQQVQYVCVDEDEFLGDNSYNLNSLVSTYCNFTPGGNFNTITGKVSFDSDNNGCDFLDIGSPFVKIKINDGTLVGSSFVNTLGNYNFFTTAGNFIIEPDFENLNFFNTNPSSVSVDFQSVNNLISVNNFCITPNGIHPDLEIAIAPIEDARPGFEAVYKIVYKNKGNQILSKLNGISFSYNQNLMQFLNTSISPSSHIPGSLTWNYVNLMPFESKSILVTFKINRPTDVNAVNNGDILVFTGTILSDFIDETPADNNFILQQTVVGSFDPNDITCLQGNILSSSEIGKYLHYLVRFENTGNYYAENVVVKDIIDLTKFEVASLQVLESSHAVTSRVNGNIAEFIFEGIRLDPGEKGNILLKLKSKATLVTGDQVSKKASIYFDYNFPIVTNDANTVFQTLSIGEHHLDNSIKMYPNPVNDFVTVQASSLLKSVEFYDVQGRILQTNLVNETETKLELSKYASGIYYLKIKTDQGYKVEKLIKK